jgi:hypothetical protein
MFRLGQVELCQDGKHIGLVDSLEVGIGLLYFRIRPPWGWPVNGRSTWFVGKANVGGRGYRGYVEKFRIDGELLELWVRQLFEESVGKDALDRAPGAGQAEL